MNRSNSSGFKSSTEQQLDESMRLIPYLVALFSPVNKTLLLKNYLVVAWLRSEQAESRRAKSGV
jgi:hypothetical protein